VVASGHATNPFLYAKLPYDTFKDFTPISLLASSPNILLVRADSPYKTLADLLAAARANPGKLSYGMAGNGTSTHLAGELLKPRQGRYSRDPLQGRRPGRERPARRADPDLDQQRTGIHGQISAGSVRALGVTTAKRAAILPDVPTIAEAGVPGYDTAVWWGLLGPANMPAMSSQNFPATLSPR